MSVAVRTIDPIVPDDLDFIPAIPDDLVRILSRTWAEVKAEYPTWADVKTSFPTWYQVLWYGDPAFFEVLPDALAFTVAQPDVL